METNPLRIHNTVTRQEIIVLFLVSLIFVAQPFAFGGPRIPVFTLSFIGLWLLIRDHHFRHQVGVYRLGIIFLLFLIPGLISYWNTYSVGKTTQFVFAIPAFYCTGITMYSLLGNRRVMQILMTVIAITSFAWVIDAMIQFVFGKDLLGIPLMDGGRVGGPFQNSTHMGLLLSVTLPVTLKWLTRYGWVSQLIYLVCLGFVLILAGVRTDWVTYLVAVVLFFAWTKRGRILLLVGLTPMLIIVGCIGLASSSIAQQKAGQFLTFPTTYEDWNNRLSKRLDIWVASWNMAVEHPITGVGSKAFNHAYEDFKAEEDPFNSVDGVGGAYHAHHPWFSVLAETGFTGVLGLIGIVVLMFGITLRTKIGLCLYRYPWLLTFILILNPVNSMMPLFKIWWFPIVLLSIVAHFVDVERVDSEVIP